MLAGKYKPAATGSSFVPLITEHYLQCGAVVKTVITLACHARGRGFESLLLRHFNINKAR